MIKVLSVGKIKEKSVKSICDDYAQRISKYHKIELQEVSDYSLTSFKDEDVVKKKEAEELQKRIKDNDYVVVLDLKGTQIDSVDFANKITSIFTYEGSNITFVIGGSFGLDDSIINRANYRWQLSKLTFPHNLAKLFLLEQIYRSFKIINNESYHK